MLILTCFTQKSDPALSMWQERGGLQMKCYDSCCTGHLRDNYITQASSGQVFCRIAITIASAICFLVSRQVVSTPYSSAFFLRLSRLLLRRSAIILCKCQRKSEPGAHEKVSHKRPRKSEPERSRIVEPVC